MNESAPNLPNAAMMAEAAMSLFGAGGIGFQQSTGFAPTMSQFAASQRNHAQQMQFAEQMLQTDRRIRYMTDQLSQRMNGMGLDAWAAKDPNAARFTQQAIGRILSNPTISQFTGGSPMDLVFGLQTMVGNSGMRLSGQQLFGQGAVTNLLTRDLFQQFSRQFEDDRGFLDRRKTFGFDRTELAQVFSVMGEQGAFSGMDMGEIKRAADGSFQVGLNEGSRDRITKSVSEAAKTLRMLKDVFGDRSMRELSDLAQNLSGIGIGEFGGSAAIRDRIAGTLTSAAALGFDPRRAIEFDAQMKQALEYNGFGTASAGALSGVMTPRMLAGFRAGQERAQTYGAGLNLRYATQSLPAMAAEGARAMSAFIRSGDNDLVVAAANALEVEDLSSEQRAAILTAMRDGSPEGRERLFAILSPIVGDPNTYLNKRGGAQNVLENMGIASRGLVSTAFDSQLNSRQANLIRTNVMRNARIDAEDRGMMGTLLTRLNPSTATALAAAADEGAGLDKLRAILNSDVIAQDMSEAEKSELLGSLMSGRGRVKGSLKRALDVMRNDPRLGSFRTESQTAEQLTAQGVALSDFTQNSDPTLTFTQQLLRGLTGQGAGDDRTAVANLVGFLADKGLEFAQNATAFITAGGKITPADRAKLEAMLGPEFANAVTAAGGYDKLSSSAEGRARLSNLVKRAAATKGHTFGSDKDGNLRVFNREYTDKLMENDAVGRLRSAESYNLIAKASDKDTLGTLSDADQLLLAKYSGMGDEEIQKLLAAGPNTELSRVQSLRAQTASDKVTEVAGKALRDSLVNGDTSYTNAVNAMGLAGDKAGAGAIITRAIEEERTYRRGILESKSITETEKEKLKKESEERENKLRGMQGENGAGFIGFVQLVDLDKVLIKLVSKDGATANKE